MRLLFLTALLASYSAFAADYRLDPAASVSNGTLGAAKLASTSISVTPRDRYRVQVKLLQGSPIVAEKEVRYPD